MNVLLNFTGNVLVVGGGAGCYTDDEENQGKEPSQVLLVQASSGCPLQELSMTKEASSGCPLQELSMTKEASCGRPLQELSMTKEASSSRPLQELSISKERVAITLFKNCRSLRTRVVDTLSNSG